MKKKNYLYIGEEIVVDQNDFYNSIADGLVLLASNLKQTLEEANGITKSESNDVETDLESQENQNLESNSPIKEN